MNGYNKKIIILFFKVFSIVAALLILNTFDSNTAVALDIKSMTDSGNCKNASQKDWGKAGLDYGTYLYSGISLCDAIEWKKAGFNDKAARAYHSEGFSLSDAKKRRQINKDILFDELKEKIDTSELKFFDYNDLHYNGHAIEKRIKLFYYDLIATLTNSYDYNGEVPYIYCFNKVDKVRTTIHSYYIYKHEISGTKKDKDFDINLKKIEEKLAYRLSELQKDRHCKTDKYYNLPDLLTKVIQFIDDYDKFADSLHKERAVLIKEKTIEENAKAKKEQERKKAEKEEIEKKEQTHIVALRSGKQQVQNLQNALWKFDATTDTTYTIQAPIDGPSNKKRYYVWRGLIATKMGDLYLCWDGRIKQGFAFKNIKKTFLEIRQNIYVDVVGRYVDNTEITLVDGSSAVIPVLTDSYVFSAGY